MNPELQKFVDQEKQANNGIDTQEIKTLDALLYNNNKELSEEAKNILTPVNSNAMVDQIQNFLRSDEGKKIDAATEQHYMNILDTLNNLNKNVNIKNKIDDTKNTVNEKKISNSLGALLVDQMTDTDGKPLKLLDERIMSDIITNFINQYNNNNDSKIDTKLFGFEELYNLPNEQKDAFATKLAQVIFRKEQNEGKRSQATSAKIEQVIRGYRQEFFNKCFKDGDVMPALFEQKNIVLWDQRWATKWLYKGDIVKTDTQNRIDEKNIWWFSYDRESFRSNNTIDRKAGQDTMDIAMLADGVDVGWVDFTVKIDENTTIKWYTKGIFPDKASRDRYMTLSPSEKEQYRKTLPPENLKNTTMIVWETSGQLPEGISLNKWGIQIDAQKMWKQPRVNIDVNSPERDDETFVTINTNWLINTPWEIAAPGEVLQQKLFENGLHKIEQAESTALNKTIEDIKKLINDNKISQQGLLRINVESTTDKSQIVETLHNQLKQDLIGLKDSFLKILEAKYGKELWWQKFNEIQANIALKVKDRDDNDGNKVLAQCRAYEGMQYIINNIGDEYLNKINFNIKNIQWNQNRSFRLYALWETIKQSTKKVSSPLTTQ